MKLGAFVLVAITIVLVTPLMAQNRAPQKSDDGWMFQLLHSALGDNTNSDRSETIEAAVILWRGGHLVTTIGNVIDVHLTSDGHERAANIPVSETLRARLLLESHGAEWVDGGLNALRLERTVSCTGVPADPDGAVCHYFP